MSLALYWAVSTGMWDATINPTPSKKATINNPGKLPGGSSRGSSEASEKLSS
jgi:hypothetical protein